MQVRRALGLSEHGAELRGYACWRAAFDDLPQSCWHVQRNQLSKRRRARQRHVCGEPARLLGEEPGELPVEYQPGVRGGSLQRVQGARSSDGDRELASLDSQRIHAVAFGVWYVHGKAAVGELRLDRKLSWSKVALWACAIRSGVCVLVARARRKKFGRDFV